MLVFHLIRINQLLVSATMCNLGSWVSFATFIYQKITTFFVTQPLLKLEKIFLHSFEIHKIKKNFDACVTKLKSDQNLLHKNSHICLMNTKLLSE